jgi:hypothetical protein
MTAGLTLRTQLVGLRPEFDHVREIERRAVRTPKGAATVQSRTINTRPLRRAKLTWKTANDGTRVEVRRLFAAASGCILPLNYTPVGKTDADAFEVQIVPDSLRLRRASQLGRHEIEFEVEEAL